MFALFLIIKTRGSCYLFDCGTNEDFRCKFTPHNFYTSSTLQFNRHSYDLSQWGSQIQHEKELTKLRGKSMETTATPTLKMSTLSSSSRSLMPPSIAPVTTVDSLLYNKSNDKINKYYINEFMFDRFSLSTLSIRM